MHHTFSLPAVELASKWIVSQHLSAQRAHAFGLSSGFELVALGDIAAISSGLYIRNYTHVGVPYMRVDNVRKLVLDTTAEDVVLVGAQEAGAVPGRCKSRRGDVLIARTGTLGKASLIAQQSHAGYVLSQHVTRIATADAEFLPGYICLFLNSRIGSLQLLNLGMGSTRPELTHEALSNLSVPRLSFARQIAFSDRLERELVLYYQYVSKISELVLATNDLLGCGEDTAANGERVFQVAATELGHIWTAAHHLHRTSDSLQAVESKFGCSCLGEFSIISRGRGTRVSSYTNKGVPFIRTSSLINYSIDPLPDHHADESLYEEFGQHIEDGDILYSIEGRIGAAAILYRSVPVVFKNHIERIRLLPGKISYPFTGPDLCGWVFLCLASNYGQRQAKLNTVVQSTIPGLASRLRDIRIPLSHPEPSTVLQMRRHGSECYEIGRRLMGVVAGLRTLQAEFDAELAAPHDTNGR